MILSSARDQEKLRTWLCDRIGLVPSPDFVCIGNYLNGKICGVVGYDGYNGASIQMHVAGDNHWFTKDMLRAAFDYPFEVCNVNMVLGFVPSGNLEAIRFNEHLGFKVKIVLEGAHPDGALLIMAMTREECRFLTRIRNCHGQKEQAATSA